MRTPTRKIFFIPGKLRTDSREASAPGAENDALRIDIRADSSLRTPSERSSPGAVSGSAGMECGLRRGGKPISLQRLIRAFKAHVPSEHQNTTLLDGFTYKKDAFSAFSVVS
jgi:hypothetical protein